ncbi:unnamed protein product [Trichobilharzia regenti]|nr:unnamed protein product [Trichobilharzia regenti]
MTQTTIHALVFHENSKGHFVTFETSGIPVGTNILNYDDVRQVDEFKNVSLGNVLSARFKDPKTEFQRNEDKKMYVEHAESSFELQVGLHELLGYDSDKCRAERVGIYSSDLPLVLEQFGLNTDCAQGDVLDVVYINWLSMTPSVVTSMEFYSPAKNANDIGS